MGEFIGENPGTDIVVMAVEVLINLELSNRIQIQDDEIFSDSSSSGSQQRSLCKLTFVDQVPLDAALANTNKDVGVDVEDASDEFHSLSGPE